MTLILNVILLMASYKCLGRHIPRSNRAQIMDYTNASANNAAHHRYGNGRPRLRNARIIGGHPIGVRYVPSIAAMVILKHSWLPVDTLQCGATIIDRWWVVTAAHCIELMQESGFTTNHVVIATGHREWRLGFKHPVRSIIVHEDYDKMMIYNDIAVMSVKKPFGARYEKPAPVASSEYPYAEDETVRVAGWGFTMENQNVSQDALRAVDVGIVSQRDCHLAYGYSAVSDGMVCAGDPVGGKDACQYDSGGPLYHGNLLIGIASWGEGCGRPKYPGVYTKIGMYQKWLVANTREPRANIKFRKKP